MKLTLVSIVSMALTAMAAEPQRHTFTSGDYIITMDVHYFDPYVGKRLVFYSGTDDRTESSRAGNGEAGAHPSHFVGSVATVTLAVKRVHGKLRGKTSIREYVTVTAQSPDLPSRPPFNKKQVLTNGVITDIEAFGYDEGDVAEGAREAVRQRACERLWRLCHQELYLNDDKAPFATIDWRYTLNAIKIVDLKAEPLEVELR
jgi:hypothetical protein